MKMSEFRRAILKWFDGGPAPVDHTECRIRAAHLRGESIGLMTRLNHAILKQDQSERDVYCLEMEFMRMGRKGGCLVEVLDVIDQWREKTGRPKLGRLRPFIEDGTLVPETDPTTGTALVVSTGHRMKLLRTTNLVIFALLCLGSAWRPL